MQEENSPVTSIDSLRFELDGRMSEISAEVGKYDLSLRWEAGARIVRVGFLVQHYEWAARMRVIELATKFQQDHLDDFAVDFDVIPYDSVLDSEFAEA
ncbi:Uncharacterised protein [Mycobacteroides abscessus subsp. abscessus]|nr:hypothetical protein D2E87_08275 [Mycobacteroides abscessus]SHW64554.1 Uncharacterised protein [Mycobacteroides abscessus subsp. abscessus]SIB01602.1 Uncharacterised protein [Mycobacteroides abscessus subsp. abscessus]SKJ16889.1 Uncharacterised protein [Mycobacteroides abscessus subsp. abscessus]SKN62612.1 Uncharacterised protein [Mycobacteroides abscessus subsp. abscessus]